MLPALLEAQKLQASQDTAAAIVAVVDRLAAVEAKQDELLALLKAPPAEKKGK